jgi:hypothetical protein
MHSLLDIFVFEQRNYSAWEVIICVIIIFVHCEVSIAVLQLPMKMLVYQMVFIVCVMDVVSSFQSLLGNSAGLHSLWECL